MRARNPDSDGAAAALLLVAGLMIPPLVVGSLYRLAHGPQAQGAILLSLAALTAAVLLVTRRGGDLRVTGNVLAAVLFAIGAQGVVFRGGLEGGALRALGIAPMVAVFVAGPASGAAWAVAATLEIAAVAVLESKGVRFVDQTPPGERLAAGVIVSLASLFLMSGLGVVYIAGRKRSEARHLAMLEALPDALFRMSRDGVYLDFHANRDLATSPDSFLGRRIADVLPTIAAETLRAIEAALTHRTPQVFQCEVPSASGVRHCEVRIAPAWRDEVLVVVRDLSAQEQLRARLELVSAQRHEALEEARLARDDRVMALGQLAAGVGHEINNPLSYILGNVTFAREVVGTDDMDATAVRQALDEAVEGSRRIRSVVADLKTFARADPERVRSVRVEDAIEDALKMCTNQLRHCARIVRELGETPRVRADLSRLTQVFVNLLINAAQALPDGRAEENAVVVRSFTDERGWAVAEVSDTGAGMTPEVLQKALDPFFTTKALGVGTGLGLSVSSNIARAYGGTLKLSSISGAGTTARVALPPAGLQSVSTRPPQEPAEPPVKSARVLVVDDDALVRRSLARLLRGSEVVCVGGGREALDHLARDAAFDIVLCDVMMPDMTGIELHDVLKDSHPELAARLVFVTGGAFTAEAASWLEKSGVPVLQKPLDPEELRNSIDRAQRGETMAAKIRGDGAA